MLIDVSHPLPGTPSQSANPAAQTIPHTPAVHVAVVFAALTPGHAPPHAAQLCGSVIKLTSQPFVATPSQLPNPALHVVREQAPPVHALDACGTTHECPQVPQFIRSDAVIDSHPFNDEESQSVNPAVHAAIMHVPVVQLAPAFANTHA